MTRLSRHAWRPLIAGTSRAAQGSIGQPHTLCLAGTHAQVQVVQVRCA